MTAGRVPLSGRTAIVTGASRGIGRAIALRLAADGAGVVLVARSEQGVARVADEIAKRGGQSIQLCCDLTHEDSAKDVIERAAAEFGGIDILINNAGGAHRVRQLHQLDHETFEVGTQLNYASVYRMMHAAAPYLFESPQASVLNVVSIAAERGLVGMSYYSAAKSAVIGLSRVAAQEWGSHGVRVNCLGPGWIETDLSEPLRADAGFAASTLSQIPLGRWGAPDDIANVAAFLVSDAAAYVSGATLFVDGGLLA